jgi:hypothetical protein
MINDLKGNAAIVSGAAGASLQLCRSQSRPQLPMGRRLGGRRDLGPDADGYTGERGPIRSSAMR